MLLCKSTQKHTVWLFAGGLCKMYIKIDHNVHILGISDYFLIFLQFTKSWKAPVEKIFSPQIFCAKNLRVSKKIFRPDHIPDYRRITFSRNLHFSLTYADYCIKSLTKLQFQYTWPWRTPGRIFLRSRIVCAQKSETVQKIFRLDNMSDYAKLQKL